MRSSVSLLPSLLATISFLTLSQCRPQGEPTNIDGKTVPTIQDICSLNTDPALADEAPDLDASALGDRYPDYIIPEHPEYTLHFSSNRNKPLINVYDAISLLNYKVIGRNKDPEPGTLVTRNPAEKVTEAQCGIVLPPASQPPPPLQFYVANPLDNPAFTIQVALWAVEGYRKWMCNQPDQRIRIPAVTIRTQAGEFSQHFGSIGFFRHAAYDEANPIPPSPILFNGRLALGPDPNDLCPVTLPLVEH